MIGALTWEPPTETPAWLDEIEGPLVLVTTSSEYQADEALVRAAAGGAGRGALHRGRDDASGRE